MVSLLLTLNALICVALIILILLQRSDPASGGMFGGAGGGGQPVVRNPLAKPTAILAALFLVFSVLTALLNKGGAHATIMVEETPAEAQVPALPEASLLGAAAVSSSVAPAAEAPANVPVTTSPTE